MLAPGLQKAGPVSEIGVRRGALERRDCGHETVTAPALVDAAGPWVEIVN